MASKLTEQEAAARRLVILQAARWCFLNFGFGKTSLDDIAKRAGISRTLLYRTFKDKEEIFSAVFAYWLTARHPEARQAVLAPLSASERLLAVCQVVVLDPWIDMVGAPMSAEFHDICERIDPGISLQHRQVAHECVSAVLGDDSVGEVFLLALDGLLADQPSPATLEQRVRLLVDRFTAQGTK